MFYLFEGEIRRSMLTDSQLFAATLVGNWWEQLPARRGYDALPSCSQRKRGDSPRVDSEVWRGWFSFDQPWPYGELQDDEKHLQADADKG